MNITLDQKDTTNASIQVLLEEGDYQSRVDKKLKDYSKTATIKGFRPGKVPTGLLKKMYGKSILVEEVNNILAESVDAYIKENKLAIVGDPLPNYEEAKNIDWETQREFSFSYDIGLVPEFSYDLNTLSLTRYEVEITDQELKESLENLQARHGDYIKPETVSNNDLLFGSVKQVNGDFQKDNAYLFINKLTEETKALFLEKTKDTTVTFDIQNSFAEVDSLRLFTQLPLDQASQLEGPFEFTINEIDRQVPAQLNEEFFTKVYGEDIKTEEEFNARLKEELQKLYIKETESRLTKAVQEQLVEQTSIELPNDFLKRWLKVSNKDISEETIANEYEDFVKGLKWTLIKDKIAKDHDLKVEHEEVLEQAKASFKEVYAFLQTNTPENEDLLNRLADNYLRAENGQNYMNVFQRAFTDKVAAFVKETVKTVVEKVPAAEFNKAEA